MPIFRSETVRFARRLSVVLASLAGMSGALAAPHLQGPTPTSVVGDRTVAESPTAVSDADALSAFVAEKGVAATPPTDPGLVDRVRDKASDMVMTAMNFLGVPYRAGGSSADHGFDCSGFTRHIFELSIGRVLPRRADEQANTAGLLRIRRDELRPGDLVFFNTMRRTFSHVGIYVGEGKFIHSPRPGGEVRVDDMRATYWDQRYTGGRRADTMWPAAAATPSVRILN